jgi:UDPglucose 6-dehydrogenase
MTDLRGTRQRMSGASVMASTQPPDPVRGLNIAVVGGGYVGVVAAACLAKLGHRVALLEVRAERVGAMRAGVVPFYEPGLQRLLGAGIAAGRIQATDDAGYALSGRDAILVCVGTPLDEDGGADLTQLQSACAAIADHAPGTAVVIRSTLPLGTSASLAAWLRRTDLRTVVTNPEFLREGTAIADFLAPTRIVIGTRDGQRTRATQLVERLYDGLDAPIIVTDYASADMIKNAANAFLATKLSFINEIADLCEAYGADIERVVEGIGLDPRIGPSYLRPGIGFGGSCLPKELSNLMRLGRRKRLPVHLLQAASHDNGGRARRIVARIDTMVDGLPGRRAALLGLSFKPGTDDLRYSPAVALAETLLARGAHVVAHDPVVPIEHTGHLSGLERAADVAEACRGADVIVLATDWPEYGALDWRRLAGLVARPLLFDGRNALNATSLRQVGWEVVRIGQASPHARPASRRPRARRRPGAGSSVHGG